MERKRLVGSQFNCRKPSVSGKIITVVGSARARRESGLLLTDGRVGHCITPQAPMYLDFDGNASPPRVVVTLVWLGFLESVYLKSVLAPMCGMEISRKLPCLLEKSWLHNQDGYPQLDEAETEGCRMTAWTGNPVGGKCRPLRNVLC